MSAVDINFWNGDVLLARTRRASAKPLTHTVKQSLATQDDAQELTGLSSEL